MNTYVYVVNRADQVHQNDRVLLGRNYPVLLESPLFCSAEAVGGTSIDTSKQMRSTSARRFTLWLWGSKSKKDKGRKKQATKRPSQETSKEDKNARKERQLANAKVFFRLWSNQKLDEVVNFISPDAVYYLKDMKMEVLAREALEVYHALFASFPDYFMEYESITAVPGQNTVLVRNIVAKMTHTGTPFAMDPYPSLEPSGKYVEDGPMDCIYHFNEDDVISRVVIDAHGESVGFPAIYTKLGGLMI